MTMNKTDFDAIEMRFRNILDRYAGQMSKEGRENVQHFIEAAEIEMACESFVLSVSEEKVKLTDDVKKELLDLVLALRLDKESVFRADFWQIASPLLREDG